MQNYACALSSTNSGPAQATVGLVVANLYQCTGTLINDVPGDNTPYVLTARHCQTGKLGGGNPGAAATVTVYWNAMTACGQALGSLYDPNVPVQTGAASLVEQQDAWLIRLDASPIVTGAQFAGFDASGRAIQGGYTIHHALGFDKQLVNWRGAALAQHRLGVLGVTYASDFWDVVNAAGNSGPGASGSGLFDAANHLVGALSLGRSTADASGYESCPVPQGAAPNGANGTNDFTSLAAVWNSTADPTGTAATLRSVLDPQGTGVLQTATAPAASMSFTSSFGSVEVGSSVLLSWNAAGASQCVASGGQGGDGWAWHARRQRHPGPHREYPGQYPLSSDLHIAGRAHASALRSRLPGGRRTRSSASRRRRRCGPGARPNLPGARTRRRVRSSAAGCRSRAWPPRAR